MFFSKNFSKIRKAVFIIVTCFGFSSAYAGMDSFDSTSAPKVDYLVRWDDTHRAQFNLIYPQQNSLTTLLQNTVDQTTYALLLTAANNLAASAGVTGRVVITLPDGTVVVDTAKGTNTYANYIAKTINENHNSRVSIYDAQAWVGGIGVERKFSSTTQTTEIYTAVRLGAYLNNQGTVRLSTH